jgi:hypothetical protein
VEDGVTKTRMAAVDVAQQTGLEEADGNVDYSRKI